MIRLPLLYVFAVAALVFAVGSPLFAEDESGLVGKDAPKFKAEGRIINQPDYECSPKACEGRVVLIMEWTINDATERELPKVQKLWEKHGKNTLRVFAIHRLKASWYDVWNHCADKKFTFPVVMGGFDDTDNDFTGYKAPRGFRTTIVGEDGKVVFHGKNGWHDEISKLFKETKYPGLGVDKVAPGALAAAKKFVAGEYGQAMALMEEKLQGESVGEALKESADLIVSRCQQIADQRNKRIEKLKKSGHYLQVHGILESLKSDFKGHGIASEATKALEELESDDEAKKGKKAGEELRDLKEKHRKDYDILLRRLRSFATARKGTAAAKDAERLIWDLEGV